ncbi:2TM domain-containing protein [Phenylobacterium sp.]|uniref:2TM domain-containing protein n=1 Tax=Phenylobacterium sp. TaxID=1871053 RepID=UPI002732D4D8|nr:2TM domain-containing protein [Phenylobacterium sp.]MDP3855992.1 2TM domain-containing protein [Phenylobacterium sp.]
MSDIDSRRQRATRRADAKLSFLIHLACFVVFIAGQAALELLLWPGHTSIQWTVMGWGTGVLIHGLAAYIPFGSLRERMLRAELRREGA